MKRISTLLTAIYISCSLQAQDSLNISVLFHWADTSLPASTNVNNTYNEVWGFVQDGREYAVIGSTMGAHIFDVTDPINSTMVMFIPGAYQGSGVIHRDYHDYNGYLYMVGDQGQDTSTLQIAALSYLPDSAPVVYRSLAIPGVLDKGTGSF